MSGFVAIHSIVINIFIVAKMFMLVILTISLSINLFIKNKYLMIRLLQHAQ